MTTYSGSLLSPYLEGARLRRGSKGRRFHTTALFSAAFSSFHDSAAMESAAVAGLGGRAVGIKAIGSVLGNGLTRNGRLKASKR